jgi:hypothetical protein
MMARIVSPFDSQTLLSSSSSAKFAKTSGSSSSGGKVDTQHIRPGSNTMLPTIRAPDANEPRGDPIEKSVMWVMRADRVCHVEITKDVDIAFPSQGLRIPSHIPYD